MQLQFAGMSSFFFFLTPVNILQQSNNDPARNRTNKSSQIDGFNGHIAAVEKNQFSTESISPQNFPADNPSTVT